MSVVVRSQTNVSLRVSSEPLVVTAQVHELQSSCKDEQRQVGKRLLPDADKQTQAAGLALHLAGNVAMERFSLLSAKYVLNPTFACKQIQLLYLT